MAKIENFSKDPHFAFWPKLPILRKLWKMFDFSANSRCFIYNFWYYQNLDEISHPSILIRLRSEKYQLFSGLTNFGKRMANFRKGFPFAFWPKLPKMPMEKYRFLSYCFIEQASNYFQQRRPGSQKQNVFSFYFFYTKYKCVKS